MPEALLPHLEVAAGAVSSAAHGELAVWLPPKDRPVLAAAIAMGCDALVTGDATHFGPGYGREFGGVTVMSARALALHVLGG